MKEPGEGEGIPPVSIRETLFFLSLLLTGSFFLSFLASIYLSVVASDDRRGAYYVPRSTDTSYARKINTRASTRLRI